MADELKKAQDHLDAEEDDKALEASTAAVAKFREAKSPDNLADALLINVCALIAKDSRKEANKLAQDELVTFTTAGHKSGQAKMQLAIGEANCKNRGRENKEKALQASSNAQEMFAALGDKRNEAKAHMVIANIQVAKGSAADAARAANKARSLFDAAGDKQGEGIAQHCLAVAFKADGETEQCLQAAKAAIACFQEAGLKNMEAFQHIIFAKWTNEVERKPAKALQLALKAQQACRRLGCKEHQALGMVVECYLALAKKDGTNAGSLLQSAKAVRAAQQGIDHFQAAGNKVAEAHARQSMTMALISEDKKEEAANAAEFAAQVFREVGLTDSETQMLHIASNLYEKTGRSDQAAATAEEMLKKAGNQDSKVLALEAACQAYMQKKEFTKAKDTAQKMCGILKQAKLKHKEGLAKLLLCEVYYKNSETSGGVTIGREAQTILKEMGDVAGEAKALRTVAKIHFAAQEYEFAQRAAVRARELVRTAGDDPQAEGDAALLLGNIRLMMLKMLDERTSDQVFTNFFFEMLDSAKEARWIGKSYGNSKLVASAFKLMAEAYVLVNEIPDAIKFAQQASSMFREMEEDRNLAYVLLVEAEAWFAGGEQNSANRPCKQALKIFQELGDEAGKAMAEDAMERYNPPTPPPELAGPSAQELAMIEAAAKKPRAEQNEIAAHGAPGAAGAAYQRRQLAKVNMNKIDEELLRDVMYNVIQEVVGYEMDFLEDDLPLMQAGIASRQAVTLRAALEDEFDGISFPATIVFDFPTISAIKDYIVDAA